MIDDARNGMGKFESENVESGGIKDVAVWDR